jgi:hypothetical protein
VRAAGCGVIRSTTARWPAYPPHTGDAGAAGNTWRKTGPLPGSATRSPVSFATTPTYGSRRGRDIMSMSASGADIPSCSTPVTTGSRSARRSTESALRVRSLRPSRACRHRTRRVRRIHLLLRTFLSEKRARRPEDSAPPHLLLHGAPSPLRDHARRLRRVRLPRLRGIRSASGGRRGVRGRRGVNGWGEGEKGEGSG